MKDVLLYLATQGYTKLFYYNHVFNSSLHYYDEHSISCIPHCSIGQAWPAPCYQLHDLVLIDLLQKCAGCLWYVLSK